MKFNLFPQIDHFDAIPATPCQFAATVSYFKSIFNTLSVILERCSIYHTALTYLVYTVSKFHKDCFSSFGDGGVGAVQSEINKATCFHTAKISIVYTSVCMCVTAVSITEWRSHATHNPYSCSTSDLNTYHISATKPGHHDFWTFNYRPKLSF